MIIVLLLVFVSVILLVEGAWLLWRARHGAAAGRLQRRLDLVGRKSDAEGQRPLLKSRRLSELSGLARALSGVAQDGKVIGRFRATGVRPKACERLKASGVHLPADMFEGVTEVR